VSAPRVAPPEPLGSDPIAGSVLAHQPELLQAFLKLYGVLWSHGELDQATKELVRIRNARIVGCPICKAIRFSGARREGLTEAVLDHVRDGWEAAPLDARQKAVLRFTDVFLSAPGDLGDADRRTLLAELDPPQVVELAAALALFMGFSKIAVALGGLPESIPVHEQPTPDWSPPAPQ
jgi:AhpD family alkylhydroperoxidase